MFQNLFLITLCTFYTIKFPSKDFAFRLYIVVKLSFDGKSAATLEHSDTGNFKNQT